MWRDFYSPPLLHLHPLVVRFFAHGKTRPIPTKGCRGAPGARPKTLCALWRPLIWKPRVRSYQPGYEEVSFTFLTSILPTSPFPAKKVYRTEHGPDAVYRRHGYGVDVDTSKRAGEGAEQGSPHRRHVNPSGGGRRGGQAQASLSAEERTPTRTVCLGGPGLRAVVTMCVG